jgi:hypothetical protein
LANQIDPNKIKNLTHCYFGFNQYFILCVVERASETFWEARTLLFSVRAKVEGGDLESGRLSENLLRLKQAVRVELECPGQSKLTDHLDEISGQCG